MNDAAPSWGLSPFSHSENGTAPLEPRAVDLQINGYAGVDFNADDLDAERLGFACRLLREDGVAGILATLITDAIPRMCKRLRRIADIARRDATVRSVVWGLHVEGPFLNASPGFVGAHPPAAVRPANLDDAKRLLDAGDGMVRIVTLAPERDAGMGVTRWLAAQNVLVSAGHTDASLDELLAAIDAGLSMFTHLGNGCPKFLHRHDNIIQRALSLSDRLAIGFIADGVHVPLPALGNYLRMAGMDRAFVVTDAIEAARLGPGQYSVGGQTVRVGEDLVARSEDGSHFVGSTTTMPRTAKLLREQLHLPPEDVEKLLWTNPRRLLGQ